MKTYSGHCHCEAVRYEVDTDLTRVIECNCSHCAMKGLILTFVPAAQFRLLSGEDNLAVYRFNRGKIDHLFCRTCGVESFGRGRNSKGDDTVSINIRCLDDVDPATISVTPFDGKNL